ncbi:CPBP family intramembrane metalloprotease [Clostridia bacterium]|nr:CPBP family intramembrane metalloprotease [Clostridia bacterium]
MQKSLSSNNWNIWDALIVLATVVLFRAITRLILGNVSTGLSMGPVLLLEFLGGSIGLGVIHTYMQHHYYRSSLKINLTMEKPWWYVQIALISGILMFAVLTLGYYYLLLLLGVDISSFFAGIRQASGVFNRATVFMAVCIFFPLLTEVVYRGYLYLAMEKQWGNGVAMLVSSLLFSLFFFNFWLMPPLFFAGIVLVLVYEMTSSLYTSIFSMMIWQALTMAYINIF